MKLLKPRIQPVQENELTTEQRELLEPLGANLGRRAKSNRLAYVILGLDNLRMKLD